MKTPETSGLDERVGSEVNAVLAAEADVLFSDDHLARQRAQILQRIEAETRSSRVLTFPTTQPTRPSLREHRGTRWIAAAAAAGVLVGLVAGQLVHSLPMSGRSAAYDMSATDASSPDLQVVSTTLSEEEFLGQLEIAIETTGGSALRPLDELTPRVWDASAR